MKIYIVREEYTDVLEETDNDYTFYPEGEYAEDHTTIYIKEAIL